MQSGQQRRDGDDDGGPSGDGLRSSAQAGQAGQADGNRLAAPAGYPILILRDPPGCDSCRISSGRCCSPILER
jgi:hypothetical protein